MARKKHVLTIIDVWVVIGNTDTAEGRGSSIVLDVCTTEEIARGWARGKGVMGSNADVERRKFVTVDDKTGFLLDRSWVLQGETPESLKKARAAVLDKLTPAERELVGLK